MADQSRARSPVQSNTAPSFGEPSADRAPLDRGNGRGNAFMQDQLRAQTAPACTPEGPVGDYVTMTSADKATYLAELFRTPGMQGTFQSRGFNNTDQSQLAAVMQNEGGTNERRRALGTHYAGSARSLTRKLAAGGYRDLARLDGAESDRKVVLTEDERAVLTAAQRGSVDLAALSGAAGPAKDQASAALTDVGVTHQTALYDEFSALDGRQRSGERLPREDQGRLQSLGRHSLYSSGNFAQARGVSSGRFGEIYQEGQTRFEPTRYARSRDSVERWHAGGEQGAGGKVGAGGESARDWVGRHPQEREGNHDALADAETSWGTAQVMGHFADRGDLHKADGSAYGMDDMRAAGARRSPNATDVDMQISYFRDVAKVPGHLGNAEALATQYNGPGAPPSYADGLRSNATRYDRARDGLQTCPPERLSELEGATRNA